MTKRLTLTLLFLAFAYTAGADAYRTTIEDYTSGTKLSIESNGAMAVNIQDQHSEPIDSYFAQSVGTFTISAPTVASTSVTLVYTFTATGGHGIVATDEVLLLDVVEDRSFYAEVTNVATNVITVDRPIDHLFPSATTLGRLVITNMAVDGSSTPQVFSLRSGAVPSDITRMILTMTDGSAMDDTTFGGISALANGLVFRIVNSFQKTILNLDTNGEISQFCYDHEYSPKAGGGLYGYSARITFAGQSKHGVTLRIGEGDVLQWVVQDNLTGLVSLKISAQGHLVTE